MVNGITRNVYLPTDPGYRLNLNITWSIFSIISLGQGLKV